MATANIKTVYEFHDAANIFPLDDEHIDELAADIEKHGQQVPIELLDDKIVDGRRRYLACQRAGVEPEFREVTVADPIAYVLSLNLHRRHLTPSQLAMVGARAREIYDAKAKERQKLSQGRGVKGVENLPHLNGSGKARDQVGKAIGVSGKSIDHASRVIKHAIPEVVKAVDEGRMAVSTAALLATEPEDVQREEANDPKRRRTYQSVSVPRHAEPENETTTDEDAEQPRDIDRKGVGVIRANEAINCLIRIPKNDPLRKRGFQIVTDWIKANK